MSKQAPPHTLRHSFCHLPTRNDIDLRYIQTLLGHSSPKTMELYEQVSTRILKDIKRPAEKLNIQF
ncbi:tyrosine-type recombinase/integrase [Ohtaekwangia koreensis]|uniref:tyrosine-type recombinase/integrase n=1 Tax=Ohtaekwangia koreensis TaxID=688867 RepID=UPI0009A56B9F